MKVIVQDVNYIREPNGNEKRGSPLQDSST